MRPVRSRAINHRGARIFRVLLNRGWNTAHAIAIHWTAVEDCISPLFRRTEVCSFVLLSREGKTVQTIPERRFPTPTPHSSRKRGDRVLSGHPGLDHWNLRRVVRLAASQEEYPGFSLWLFGCGLRDQALSDIPPSGFSGDRRPSGFSFFRLGLTVCAFRAGGPQVPPVMRLGWVSSGSLVRTGVASWIRKILLPPWRLWSVSSPKRGFLKLDGP